MSKNAVLKKHIKIKTHPGVRTRRLLRNWPFLVWLAIAALCLFIYKTNVQMGEMTGVVDTISESVSPLETSRLQSIHVSIGQRVNKGDLIVQMDTSLTDAKIAEIDAQMFEAENSIGNFERSTLTIVKQFEDDIKQAQSQIETLTRLKEIASARLEELQIEQKRRYSLYKQKFMDATQANELKPEISALKEEVSAYPAAIRIEQERLNNAVQEQQNLAQSLRLDSSSENIRKAIQHRADAQRQIFEAMKQTVRIQRENCTLRASCNGIVSRIFLQPGQVVPAGTPIVRIIADFSDYVIVFLPEVYLSGMTEEQKVTVWRTSGTGSKMSGVVESIAPEIDTLPSRVSPVQDMQLRGRRVMVKLEENHGMLPGETVYVCPAKGFFSLFEKKLANNK